MLDNAARKAGLNSANSAYCCQASVSKASAAANHLRIATSQDGSCTLFPKPAADAKALAGIKVAAPAIALLRRKARRSNVSEGLFMLVLPSPAGLHVNL